MTNEGIQHPLVRAYLGDLERETAPLPPDLRRDLMAEIQEHIREALALNAGTDADVRNVLSGLGSPREVVAAARPEGTAEATTRAPGPREATALSLLVVGGLVPPVIGWIIGVALLWSSSAWTSRQKLLGTLVIPGGLLVPFLLLSVASPIGSIELFVGVPLLLGLVIAPIVTAAYLWRVAFRAA